MNEFNDYDFNDSHSFDSSHTQHDSMDHTQNTHDGLNYDSGSHTSASSHDVLEHQDPLRHAQRFEFEPFHLDTGEHFVKPHHVDPYIKQDGTLVEGYYRDGDGNTNIDHPLEAGGGYVQGNPDGNPLNNKK